MTLRLTDDETEALRARVERALDGLTPRYADLLDRLGR